MSDEGQFRSSDPPSSRAGARSVKVPRLMRLVLEELARCNHPLNGWELSQRLMLPTITVVPRLAPLRRREWIIPSGHRPGPPPKLIGQIAYIISDKGREVLAGRMPVKPPDLPQTRAWFDDAKQSYD